MISKSMHSKPNVPTLGQSSTSKSNNSSTLISSTTKLPQDLIKIMNQLKDIEIRLQDRCDNLDSICRDLSESSMLSFDYGNFSLQIEEDEDLLSAIEFSSNSDKSLSIEHLCEFVADLISKKIETKKSKENCWEKSKFWLAFSKTIIREFIWPRIIDGQL